MADILMAKSYIRHLEHRFNFFHLRSLSLSISINTSLHSLVNAELNSDTAQCMGVIMMYSKV